MRRASPREPGGAGARQKIVVTAATSAAKTRGLRRPICEPRNSATYPGAKPCGGARPSCLAKVGQPWRAFQTTNGAKTTSAKPRAAASAGDDSQRRSDGVAANASATPAAKKAAVNFD